MTEDTVDLSRKTLDGGSIETPQYDNGLIDEPLKGEPLENYDERLAGDVLESMHDVAALSAGNAKGDGVDVTVGPVTEETFDDGTSLRWFAISYGEEGYVVYVSGSEVFYRPADEFDFIMKEVKDGTAGFGTNLFKSQVNDPTEPLQGISIKRREDCLFIVDSIFGSLTGKSYNRLPVSVNDSVNENIKIRRHNKLGTDGDILKSVAAHDALEVNPTKDDKNFAARVEMEQKKAGVVGCLDNNAQESIKIRKNSGEVNETPDTFKLVLPNKARYTKVEEGFDLDKARLERGPKTRTKTSPIDGQPFDGENYIWEPGDYVIFRIEQQYGPDPKDLSFEEFRGMVTDAIDDIESGQIVTILCQGYTVEVPAMDVRPDMTVHVRNRFANCKSEPRMGSQEGMGINPETRLTDNVENDPTDYRKQYNDFNNERNHMSAFLLKDGTIVSMDPIKISIKDVSESRKVVRAMNEDRLIEVPIEDIAVDDENWPWAVIVNGDETDARAEEEPLRKIRVNPVSYVEADEESDGSEGLVEIILNGVQTKMLKKHIRLII